MALTQEQASIFIVILNYNSWEDTIECIESLKNSDFVDFQILLIDNNSKNNSQEQILKYFNGELKPNISNNFFSTKLSKPKKTALNHSFYNLTIEQIRGGVPFLINQKDLNPNRKKQSLKYPVIFVETNENLGFAGGNNVVLKALRDFSFVDIDSKIMLLNPDMFVDYNALNLINKINKDVFISGCGIKHYHSPTKQGYLGACRINKPLGKIKYITSNKEAIDYIYGGALLTNKRTLKKVGLLPENYFLYWEETDWCLSAKIRGVNLFVEPNAIVYNKIGTSIGRGYLANYYFIRNGLWFYRKFFKYYIPTLLMMYLLRIINKILKLEFEKAEAMVSGVKSYFRGESGNAFLN